MLKFIIARCTSHLLLLLCFLLAACDWIEISENAYADYDEAMKAGAIGEEKWLPKFLPVSAKDIRELHNLDTNEQWVRFRFASTESEQLTHSCGGKTRSEIRLPGKDAGDWWPNPLRQGAPDPSPGEYLYFSCGAARYLAIRTNNNVAFFWSTGR